MAIARTFVPLPGALRACGIAPGDGAAAVR
jgi:hypothetical protein